ELPDQRLHAEIDLPQPIHERPRPRPDAAAAHVTRPARAHLDHPVPRHPRAGIDPEYAIPATHHDDGRPMGSGRNELVAGWVAGASGSAFRNPCSEAERSRLTRGFRGATLR